MSIQYQSKLFGRTRKDINAEEVSINAQLLTRAGFVEKSMSGVFTFLPLGLRVIKKIENIIREELNNLGAQELLMPSFQSKEVWSKSGRWQDKVGGIMYQFKDSSGKDLGLAPSHEEMITDLVTRQVNSYKDLPLYVYQIQNKFRDEPRAKSGLLRGREFLMKDLYSFTATAAEKETFYQSVHDAYLRIFTRMGLRSFSVEASGGAMSKKYSHEFMVITQAGEDQTVFCEHCGWAQNIEISRLKKGDKCPKCSSILKQEKTVEAGNIFDQETIYTDAFKAKYIDQTGKEQSIHMAAFGIGISRAMGTIVEASHDERGIIWPDQVTPFNVHIVVLGDEPELLTAAKKLAEKLSTELDILFDDRDLSPGQKMYDADLIGIPIQIIVGKKNAPKVEFKIRSQKEAELITMTEAIERCQKYYVKKDIR